MRTGSPITDAGGTLLVKEGTELTADLIERLKTRKVVAVDISTLTPSSGIVASVRSGTLAGDEAALAYAFLPHRDNELMRSVYEAAIAFAHARRGGRS